MSQAWMGWTLFIKGKLRSPHAYYDVCLLRVIYLIMTDNYYGTVYYKGSFSGGGVSNQNSKDPGGSHFVNYTLVARIIVKAAFRLLGR